MQTVQVYHRLELGGVEFYVQPIAVSIHLSDYKRVAKIEYPDDLPLEGVAGVLDLTYMDTNSIDYAWYNTRHCPQHVYSESGFQRSTSVGDLARVGDRFFLCIPTGWTQVNVKGVK